MKSLQIKKQMHLKRANREVIVNINMFLLNQESLKGLFWNVAKIEFNPNLQTLKIGITTNDTKLGTILEKLKLQGYRTSAKGKYKILAEFYYDAMQQISDKLQ